MENVPVTQRVVVDMVYRFKGKEQDETLQTFEFNYPNSRVKGIFRSKEQAGYFRVYPKSPVDYDSTLTFKIYCNGVLKETINYQLPKHSPDQKWKAKTLKTHPKIKESKAYQVKEWSVNVRPLKKTSSLRLTYLTMHLGCFEWFKEMVDQDFLQTTAWVYLSNIRETLNENKRLRRDMEYTVTQENELRRKRLKIYEGIEENKEKIKKYKGKLNTLNPSYLPSDLEYEVNQEHELRRTE